MKVGGHFETQVYYCEAMDLFHTIEYGAKLGANTWVVVKRLNDEEILIEQFCGQRFIGVVRMLEYYKLPPAQGNISLMQPCAD